MHAIWKTALRDCRTVVELGCGFGVVLRQLMRKGLCVHGVDIFQPYLDYVNVVAPQATYERADALEWCRVQEDHSWDAIMMVDFIEHVPHEDGVEIITHAQRIARRSVLLETPKGFLPVFAKDSIHIGTPGVPDMLNPYEDHICGWEVSELEALGFRCTIRHKPRLSTVDPRPYDRITAVWNR